MVCPVRRTRDGSDMHLLTVIVSGQHLPYSRTDCAAVVKEMVSIYEWVPSFVALSGYYRTENSLRMTSDACSAGCKS